MCATNYECQTMSILSGQYESVIHQTDGDAETDRIKTHTVH